MASSSLQVILLIAVATVQVALATNYYFICDPPSPLEYGRISPSYKPKYYAGSKIKYSCNAGYRRYGPSLSVCRVYNKQAYWYPPPPVCKRKCDDKFLSPVSYMYNIIITLIIATAIPRCDKLDHPLYGSVKVSGYTHGSSAYYTCNSGYKRIGSAYRRCEKGQWNGKEPVCDSALN
jgi:hypothetical protein